MNNKNGQQMTLGTIIAIVLGLVVLVLLIYGFSTGWGNLWERITGLGGGDVNVDTIKTSCTLACQQKNVYGFCNQTRTVTVEDSAKNTTTNCKEMAAGDIVFSDATPRRVGVDTCLNLCN
jgi:hypothetical protein